METATVESVQANLDIIWVLTATALVFFMQAGFAMLEAGFTRSKNAANIVMKNLMDFCIGGLAYYAVGFGIMYGAQVAGMFGTDGFLLQGLSVYEPVTGGNLNVDFLYQAVFAGTAATIVSGGVAERMRFSGYLWVSLAMTAFIYPVVGAWKWGGGWLAALGFMDFAGSTIVHLVGGVAALMGAIALGPRIGRFAADGTPRPMPSSSVPLAMLGTFILFFGWFGFNGGSVLAADGAAIADALLTTVLAGCAGGVAATAWTWLRSGRPDVGMAANGVLAGLVGITAGADAVAPLGAVAVGLLAGVVVVLAVEAVLRLGIDDPVGAFSVHGVCGALGTIWVGIAAVDGGLLYGGGLRLLGVQVLGVAAAAAWTAVTAGLVFLAVRATLGIRVPAHEEIEGLDLHEHGAYGYGELFGEPVETGTEQVRGPAPAYPLRPVLQE